MLELNHSQTPWGRAVRVVVADDSAVVRGVLARLFAESDEDGDGFRIELSAAAPDGQSCVRVVRALHPDVVVLDLDMPGLSGLEVIDLLRREFPALPIIMFSTYTARGARATLDALARGAADYVAKPSGQRDVSEALATLREQLVPKIIALATRKPVIPERSLGSARPAKSGEVGSSPATPAQVIGIGLSTGGPAALERLLPGLPANLAVPVLIVQHMPKLFTSALVSRLQRICALKVRLAEQGDELRPGSIWLAPGDSHMEVVSGSQAVVRIALHNGALINHCRPSVDPLFSSLARVYGSRSLGVIMTGMGSDGVEGARAMVRAGGSVLAQDEDSSAVWGMPGRVVDAGLAAAVVPLEEIAEQLVARTSPREEKSIAVRGFEFNMERAKAYGSV